MKSFNGSGFAAARLSDSMLRKTYINRDMVRAARRFKPYLRYGIYTTRKPQLSCHAAV